MNCEKARRWVSDSRDVAISAERAARLERHLAGCPACRSYRDDLARIEQRVKAAAEPGLGPDYWADFSRRLEASLDAAARATPGRKSLASARWKWAWAGVSFLVVVGAATYLAVMRSRNVQGPVVLSTEEILTQVFGEIGANPELEAAFNWEILASIRETVAVHPDEAFVRFDDNPFIWEGMSEEELRFIEADLKKETDHGGQP
jgi:predicted anti-sigma-YlaC factor YlaD